MDKFFRLDSINEDFYQVFTQLREEPFAVNISAELVFNELYYQLTRMAFDHPNRREYSWYIADIKANLGWKYSADLVMIMGFFLSTLSDPTKRPPFYPFFTRDIIEDYHDTPYWEPFYQCFKQLQQQKKMLRHDFRPRPLLVDKFADKDINWADITQNYDTDCIKQVLNLWEDNDDRRLIALLILDSMEDDSTEDNINLEAEHILFSTIDILDILHSFVEEPSAGDARMEAEISSLKKEKQALQGRIAELEADNARLAALMEKRRTGTARKFTLVEIANYCKSCVDWNDVKSIVAMLNKLLRHTATENDSALVDSIEEEFIGRKCGTNIHNNFNAPVGQVIE
jgi:hypothetical protein